MKQYHGSVRHLIPCTRDCPNRNATCHSTCEKYLKFEKQNKQRRNAMLPARRAHLMKIVSRWENL